MPGAEEYRRFAAQCLDMLQRAGNPSDRARLVDLAHAFNELAARVDAESARGSAASDDK